MRRVTLVAGPPCAGKTHYVLQARQPADIVLDRDELRSERAMLDGIRRVAAMTDGVAWVIRCAPVAAERDDLAGRIRADQVLVLLPPRDVLIARAADRPNPAREFAAVDQWLRRYQPRTDDAVITGEPGFSPRLSW